MKFTKEDAYKELVAKMTAKGEKLNLSERSINEHLDNLISLVVNDETELSDFIERTLPLFKTSDANVRNDVSAGINKYKEDNPVVAPPTNPTNNAKKGADDKSELEKRMETLEKELANAKREKRMVDVRREVISRLKEKGVKNEDWMNALLSEVSITDDFDVDTKVESYLNLYNKLQADVELNSTPLGVGGGKSDYVSDAIKQAAALAKSQSLVGIE